MRSIAILGGVALLLTSAALAGSADAQEAKPPATAPAKPPRAVPATAPAPAPAATQALPPADEAVVGRARDLLARARVLDETAANDERFVVDLGKALPALRVAAKAVRERAGRAEAAARPEAEALTARAEELEAELAVDEVEVAVRRHAAESTRRLARELRALAVRVIKEPPSTADAAATCDPPYRYTADGRKLYRVECF